MLRVIELFAGIGAQAQALKEANIEHEIVAISEIDKYALRVYEALHGKPNNLGNIKAIEELPKADLWTYSFPCTDISLAGQMKGFDRDSETGSSLLWEVERLINMAAEKKTLPTYLLMENVKNLVSKRFINLFNEWIAFLESHGYKNYYQVLNAKDYGIPQNRERVFMVSSSSNLPYTFPVKQNLEKKLIDFLEKEVDEKYFLSEKLIKNFSDTTNRNGFIRGNRFRLHDEKSEYAYTISTCPGSRATDNFIMVPQKTKLGYAIATLGDGIYTNRTHQKRGVVQKNMIPTLKTSPNDIGVVVEKADLISIRRLTPRECWRLMGWGDNSIEIALSLGISETQLYKMAGNSIVINVIKACVNMNFQIL
jgi:DNA (cytosine-5)-methyltransferase 1